MIVKLERVAGDSFAGKINWPTLNNNVTSIQGEIITTVEDFIEESKWRAVKTKVRIREQDGVWLRFTESRLLAGSLSNFQLGGQYYAYLSTSGTMKGGCFLKDSNELVGDFTILLEDD